VKALPAVIEMLQGKRYLLFLRKPAPTEFSFFDPKLTYLTPLHQGKYNLDGGDCPEANFIQANEHHQKLLSQVKAKYPSLFSN
jgi:hypothetical protein